MGGGRTQPIWEGSLDLPGKTWSLFVGGRSKAVGLVEVWGTRIVEFKSLAPVNVILTRRGMLTHSKLNGPAENVECTSMELEESPDYVWSLVAFMLAVISTGVKGK